MIFKSKNQRREHQRTEEIKYFEIHNTFLENQEVITFKRFEIGQELTLVGDYIRDLEFSKINIEKFRFNQVEFDFIVEEGFNGYFSRNGKFHSFLGQGSKNIDFSKFRFEQAEYIIGNFYIKEGYKSTIVYPSIKMIFKSHVEIVEPILIDVFLARVKAEKGDDYKYGIFCSTREVILPFEYKTIRITNIRNQIYEGNLLADHSAHLSFWDYLCILVIQDAKLESWKIIDTNSNIYVEDLYDLRFIDNLNRIVACKNANYIEDKTFVCLFDFDGTLINFYNGNRFDVFYQHLIVESEKGYCIANLTGGGIVFTADSFEIVLHVTQDFYENVIAEPKFIILQKNNKFALFDIFLDCILDFTFDKIKPITSKNNVTKVFELTKNGKIYLQEISVNEGIFDF